MKKLLILSLLLLSGCNTPLYESVAETVPHAPVIVDIDEYSDRIKYKVNDGKNTYILCFSKNHKGNKLDYKVGDTLSNYKIIK